MPIFCGKQIAELQRKLAIGEQQENDAQRTIAELSDLIEREANSRAGYVYVISNIGPLGERMGKIGMARRLDPMDRVRELGDASAPFNVDVHALFFSDDAVGVETELRHRFAATRVNRINARRSSSTPPPQRSETPSKTSPEASSSSPRNQKRSSIGSVSKKHAHPLDAEVARRHLSRPGSAALR